MQGKDKTAEERRVAVCIFDDVAEECREAAIKWLLHSKVISVNYYSDHYTLFH